MNKPAQAQIEALKALLPGYEQYLEWAKERRVLFLHNGYEALEKAKDAITTLTNAAQVGELFSPEDIRKQEQAVIDAIKDDTIERCAQVADGFVDESGWGKQIAAAIRKLKDAS